MIKYIFAIALFLSLDLVGQELDVQSPLRFLALGDSYTIGQGVAMKDRWPVQLADSLEARGIVTDTVRIIATTGWRTDNLINAVKNQNLEQQQYNLVSLLIGVNNQYQGRPFSQYISEFPALLDSAIRYADGDKSRVFVVSIPDYAYTPFGQGSADPEQISAELDQYNAYSKHIADSLQVTYFDITPISRQGLMIPAYVANDGLHPSAQQYTEWVQLMVDLIDLQITSLASDAPDPSIDIILSPNPASGSIYFQMKGMDLSQPKVLRIYNHHGVLLEEHNDYDASGELDLGRYTNGLYFLQVISGGQIVTKQLMLTND